MYEGVFFSVFYKWYLDMSVSFAAEKGAAYQFIIKNFVKG